MADGCIQRIKGFTDMTVESQGSATTVHVLFHGVGVPGPGAAAEDEAFFVSRDLLLAVLDDLCGDPRREVSFDDGYDSDVSVALPALLERDMSARFFPLAGLLGRPGRVDADALGELVRSGMAVGSHGMRHRSWRRMDQAARREELIEARRILTAAAGVPVDTVACPFGAYDRSALTALRAQGYSKVFTSDRRRARDGAWLQPRYSVRRGDTLQTVREQILAVPSASRRARGMLTARLKAWR
jgi:peptidoglycan/xylan/chitin deacetylase (PgdA/CDA1 family)